ncbi:hypothetical protein DVR12_01145 [Chitinophaga silvatica]|uniref:Leucine-rich repeat domain-containing protein n=1 Tax=Chitinophaga silvatica TaxID=2282649 RepID=A0A3E1YGB9_9BACT|nr:WG repeat-containing protein [Chitinophaga silvatica]RFS26424.1 hypothetical protein DVR12_01145 [Chitinophaga silvatica]
MKKVNRHHFISWVVMLSFVIGPIYAQTIATTKASNPEKWYPIYRKGDCSMPAFINKKGEVKLAFDSTIKLAFENRVIENVFEGQYISVKRKVGNDVIYYLCDRKGNLTPLPVDIEIVGINPNSITVTNLYRKYALWKFDLTPLTPFKYKYIAAYSEGYLLAHPISSTGFTLLNEKGEETIQPVHEASLSAIKGTNRVSEGIVGYVSNDKMGIMDTKGKDITPAIFNFVLDFKNGLAFASKDYKCGYINKKGKWVMGPDKNTYSGTFGNGMSIICKVENGEEYYTFVDTTGQIAIKQKFKRVTSFENGFAVVTTKQNKPNERSVINTKGNIVFTGMMSWVDFLDDLIVIKTEDKDPSDNIRKNNWYYLDYNFKPVWEPDCTEKTLSSINNLRGCKFKDFKKIIFEGEICKSYSLNDLKELFENANPIELSIQLNSSISKLPSGLSTMTNLEILKLSRNYITELPDLSKLTNLKVLDLDNTSIKSLPKSIYNLKQLKQISVRNTNLSLDDIMELKEQLPDTKIFFKSN